MAALSYIAQAESIGLYVHIPFCKTKCPYCDFNTYAKIEDLIPSYVEALRREICLWGELVGHTPVRSVFFGGGTPSYLPPDLTGSILGAIGASFALTPGAEVTLEANPDDLTARKAQVYVDAGVNRLSIGIQSLDDDFLKLLGRRHTAAQAIEAYRLSIEAGFGSVSMDLMYGLPGQGLEQWMCTLDKAADLGPRHVSAYCLTLESGTPMDYWVRSGRTPEPDPDLAADMYLATRDAMRPLGYRHYEISNWALPGYESQHNLGYWRNQPYLGVGPGGHSYLEGYRFSNLRFPREYIRRLADLPATPWPGAESWEEAIRRVPVVAEVEAIDRRLEMAETLMLGLRLDCGVGIADFARRFDVKPADVYGKDLEEMTAAGLLETNDGSLRLTGRGRLLSNEVFSRFFD